MKIEGGGGEGGAGARRRSRQSPVKEEAEVPTGGETQAPNALGEERHFVRSFVRSSLFVVAVLVLVLVVLLLRNIFRQKKHCQLGSAEVDVGRR